MRKLSWLFALLTIVLVACSNDSKEVVEEDFIPEIIEVDLQTPERVEAGETITLRTVVTQGDETVDDADEVIYEIWEETNKLESEMIEAVPEGDGIYTLDYTFGENSVMNVQIHVTARGMHNMPVKQVIVGEGKEYEEVEETAYAAYVQTDDVESGKEETLIVHITEKGIPKNELPATFILHFDDAEPVELEVTNEERGEYRANYTFQQAGFAKLEVVVPVEDATFRAMQTINVR